MEPSLPVVELDVADKPRRDLYDGNGRPYLVALSVDFSIPSPKAAATASVRERTSSFSKMAET
jgi:hypothetical protein